MQQPVQEVGVRDPGIAVPFYTRGDSLRIPDQLAETHAVIPIGSPDHQVHSEYHGNQRRVLVLHLGTREKTRWRRFLFSF